MKHRNDILAKVLLCGTLMLGACSDDLKYDNGNYYDDEKTLIVCIPDVERAATFGMTRADGNAVEDADEQAKEGGINSLWFCAFPTGDKGAKVIKKLGTNDELQVSNSSDVNTYKQYRVEEVEEGDYKVYLLANVEDYISEDLTKKLTSGEITENEVSELSINFNSSMLLASSFPKLKAGNLPMAALPTEISTSPGGSGNADGIFSFDIESKTLYADLTFLCSKVRYTILFNREDYSKDFITDYIAFADYNDISVNKQTATNLQKTTSLYPVESSGDDFMPGSQGRYVHALPLGKYNFPGDNYPNETVGNVSADLSDKFTGNDYSKIAWQGVIYVPENKTTKEEDKTTLTFNGTIYDASGSKLADNKYMGKKVIVEDRAPGAQNGNLRGKFYEIVSKVTTAPDHPFEMIVDVADWTTQTLSYQLMGPVTLEVETTKVAVNTGETSSLWYNTSASSLSFKIPQHNGTDFYVIDKDSDPDHLLIEVNPDLSYEEILKMVDDQGYVKEEYRDNYGYFHIIANNLNKKIEAWPIKLGAFLTVSPKDIYIDLQQQIGSGIYRGDFGIEYATNLPNVSLSLASDSNEGREGFPVSEPNLYLSYNGNKISTETYSISDNNGVVTLYFQGLNSGAEIWKNNHDYSFTFTAQYTPQSGGNPIILTETVNIHIRKFNRNYVIHFRDNGGVWGNAHIYVYQCLELPKDLNGNNSQYAGYTVGYKGDGTEEAETNYFSALEYSFTGGIAFKGWKSKGGPEHNDPNSASAGIKYGFFIFEKGAETINGKKAAYNPNVDEGVKYSKNLDFNIDHRNHAIENGKSLICSSCSSSSLNGSWPGYVMEREFDSKGNPTGWWRYELSGVATPGKALLMFSDTHINTNTSCNRYPDAGEVGIPLFDFPDNEGWIECNSSKKGSYNFTSEEPKTKLNHYRLYWQGYDNIHFFFCRGNDNNVVYQTSWKSGLGILSTANDATKNWYYLDFFTNDLQSTDYFRYQEAKDNTSPFSWGNVGSFTGSDIKCAFIDFNGQLKSGKPSTVIANPKFYKGDKMIIKWYDYNNGNSWYNHIYAWNTSESFKPFGDWDTAKSNNLAYNDNYQAEFTFTSDESKMGIIVFDSSENKVEYEVAPNGAIYKSGSGDRAPKVTPVVQNNGSTYYYVDLW